MSMRTDAFAEVVERCAWCGVHLEADTQVVIAGGRFSRWSSRLASLHGHVVRVQPAHGLEPVLAVVPLPGTPAHHVGYDLLFVLCSEACRDDLDVAIGGDPMVVSVGDAPGHPSVSRGSASTTRRGSAPRPRTVLRRVPS